MNSKKIILGLAVALIFAVTFSSCQSDSKNLKRDSYIAGAEIVENIIQKYENIETENYMARYQDELISILTNTDSFPMNDFENIVFTAEKDKKIDAFRALKKVYNSYNLATDKNFVANNETPNFLMLACNSLDSLSLDETQSTKVAEIKDYISASRFNHEVALYELSLVYQQVWEEDSQNWINILNETFGKYSDGLEQVPTWIFDEEKLSKFVYEPYQGKETLVKIYKLNLKDEAYKQIDKSVNCLKGISKNYEDLNFINMENTKSEPATTEIEYKLDNLMQVLFPKKMEKEL